jgi:hypothetical protein
MSRLAWIRASDDAQLMPRMRHDERNAHDDCLPKSHLFVRYGILIRFPRGETGGPSPRF